MSIEKIKTDFGVRMIIAIVLIAFAVALRLAPLPHNFAPIAAIAIFGGAILPRRWAMSLPLIAMVLTDAVIGYHSLIWATWGAFAVIAVGSNVLLKKINVSNVIGASLASSIFFFATTNFAVWAEGRLYPPTFDGLMSSYFNALPFFRNTMLSDLIFSAVLFGSYALVYRYALHGKQSLKIANLEQTS